MTHKLIEVMFPLQKINDDSGYYKMPEIGMALFPSEATAQEPYVKAEAL